MPEEQATSSTPAEDWIIDVINGLLEAPPISPGWSICKVPRSLRSVNEDAYTPHIVSIGPIHHEDKELLPMEDHKRRYLLALFKRTEEPEEMLKHFYGHIITQLEVEVRACYAEPIPYDKSKLAKILVHDAGFLLELFCRYFNQEGISQNDPIFTTAWTISTLQRDLVLLENQIPFFVLESLFKHIAQHAVGLPPLKELALQFFKSKLNISSEEAFRTKRREKGNHLLHLLYNCYLPPKLNSPDSTSEEEYRGIEYYLKSLRRAVVDSRSKEKWENIRCATSLDQAGIKFQKSTTNDLFDFQFHNGTFKIPELLIDDSTDSLFRNLAAFEQSRRDSKHYITSYIFLMDWLIDTTHDVHLLQQKRIIENKLGGRDDVEYIFNNISKQIVLKDFYFAGLCNQVNAFAKSRRHRYCAALRRDYFKNPWSIMSFVAAITLLVLTFLQTLYSTLSYYQKS